MVELVILAMERSENENFSSDSEEITNTHWLWLHLSSQLIYFVLFQFATFPNIVMALHNKVSTQKRQHRTCALLPFPDKVRLDSVEFALVHTSLVSVLHSIWFCLQLSFILIKEN